MKQAIFYGSEDSGKPLEAIPDDISGQASGVTPEPAGRGVSELPFEALRQEVWRMPSPLRERISEATRCPEPEAVAWLRTQTVQTADEKTATEDLARRLVEAVRSVRLKSSGVDALMQEFSLSSEEGIALMCLAEALLRIPDHATADRLIADKIGKGDWRRHLGGSPSLFVNAATWGLLVTGKLVATSSENSLGSALTRLIARGGEPLVRAGVDLAMRMLGKKFVTGRTIGEALKNSVEREQRGYTFSYDMLGEAALTQEDADRYFYAYKQAIHAIGLAAAGRGILNGPGISVKLSALHPRYQRAQRERVMNELLPRLAQLVRLARDYAIGINIDAEESERLDVSLDLMEALAIDPALADFDGLGFVVQAYQKRCPFVIDWLVDLARCSGRRFMVRLVKGAYWDAEIKRAQIDGMPGYPVYTRKAHTDMSYLACAQKLLAATEWLTPQFATHNAHAVAAIHTWAQRRGIESFEFQCLHGMGETLYDQVVGEASLGRSCRIYAPVGSHQTLLAYLVRRLLENGANSSFVNQIADPDVPVSSLVADPFALSLPFAGAPHPAIPLPRDLFGAERENSAGIDLSNEETLARLAPALLTAAQRDWHAVPLIATAPPAKPLAPASDTDRSVLNPADRRDRVGRVRDACLDDVTLALAAAHQYAPRWKIQPAAERAAALRRAAFLFEEHFVELMSLAIREAGKSIPNAVAELREAVDFLRYYAARIDTDGPVEASGTTAPLRVTVDPSAGLGPVVCISPWNFPLAIFIGQISAALAAGNVVLAKPAEQTPLIAHLGVQLLHEAGIPPAALQFLPGPGATIGAALIADARVAGVIFTGSTEVAQSINQVLAKRSTEEERDVVLIAETGGQNAMIADSSALTEQVVQDVINSAFDSAGQRCSALRILCLQEDIADRTLHMLYGAMRELQVGVPDRLRVDVGPVIDSEAQQRLEAHIAGMRGRATSFFQLPLPEETRYGSFVAPVVIGLPDLGLLEREVFGPVLHVVRYRREDLTSLVDQINRLGYGLTLGIHTRLDETITAIVERAHVGNIYVNRNMVGAVVGVQPFGGEGKSGTGPKAGGPLYLARLQCNAKVELAGDRNRNLQSSFLALSQWAEKHNDMKLQALCRRYASETLLNRELVLPGPTGERNSLRFSPRGLVLCLAGQTVALTAQLAAAFACGNRIVIPAAHASMLPHDLPGAVRSQIVLALPEEMGRMTIAIAMLDDAMNEGWRQLLANREGALVPVVETNAAKPVALWRLVAERALCVNTAAAGGNASLMTLSG